MKRTLLTAIAVVAAGASLAASHNDAPLVTNDPAANITDVYSFITNGPKGQKMLNIVLTTNPLEDPGNGVNYYSFASDVMYSIHIAKADGQGNTFSGKPFRTYNFRFFPTYKNLDTILSYGLGTEAGPINNLGDARQNLVQKYNVFRVQGNQTVQLNAQPLLVPPVNVGPRTTPQYYDAQGNVKQGATSFDELDTYTKQALFTVGDGTRVWAGQREDGFYADVPAIFDFLGFRNPAQDGFSNFNVQSINLQVPVSEIVGNGEFPVVGVFATTSRRSIPIMGNGQPEKWVQVGRMGNPLFNETLVALRDKDFYNQSMPTRDAERFTKYARNCELAFLANAVLGTTFQVNNREDLVGIFIPDLLKIDTSTGPVNLAGEPGFNRLSVFGGDTVFSPFQNKQIAAGWPNGRRLGDDVVDIALTAVASGPSYSTIVSVGDNVDTNDALYNLTFPYAGTPFGGTTNGLHD